MTDTQQRIDQVVKGNRVVLFMKGDAQFPMCGFSGRAIQVLKAFVNGEFVGGSDIMTEMYQSGELQQMLGPR